MAKVRSKISPSSSRKMRPAFTTEANESQMVSLAMDLVRQRLIDGTASSQETTHFLKIGSVKAQAELEKLKRENELLRAKTEAIDKSSSSDELYKKAIKAFASYSGHGDVDVDPEDY